MMKESGAHALKLEGGMEILENIKKIIDAGIPVCGHLGLTPQSINKFGTFGVRAQEEAEAEKLKSDALALQEIGCFAIVLEKIPAKLAKEDGVPLSIPTLGSGGRDGCGGDVLVVRAMLGFTNDFNAKFLRRYMQIYENIVEAAASSNADVNSGNCANE